MMHPPSGYQDLNPARRHEIDPLAPLSMVTGQDYARITKQKLAFEYNVIVDATDRNEHPEITAMKRQAARHLAGLLKAARPHRNDTVRAYVVGGDAEREPLSRFSTSENIQLKDRAELPGLVEKLAIGDMGFVISDFNGMKFVPGSLRNTVAIKANHPSERHIPRNADWISLGGAVEINTHDKRQVEQANAELTSRHEATVANLQSAGAEVAALTTSAKDSEGYDVDLADQLIATAISDLQKRLK